MNGQLDKLYNMQDKIIDNISNSELDNPNNAENIDNRKLDNRSSKNINNQEENLNGIENEEEKALLKGILLGEKTELTEEQVDNFKVSSLSHILAVSGMHVAYIIAGTIFILRLLGISKQRIHILTILVIIFFMFLTEFTPSVVRAGIMAILVLIAFLVKRKSDVWINISISSLIILMCNPYVLLSMSYQLSFLGTIGIILGVKVVSLYREKKNCDKEKTLETMKNKNSIKKSIKEILKDRIFNKTNISNILMDKKINKTNITNILGEMKVNRDDLIQILKDKLKVIKQYFIDIVVVCLSAQLFVFPIILLNFNTISIYFLISNLLIAPIIGVIIILGFMVIFISYICYPLAFYLNFIEILLLKFMNIMTNFISNLPNSYIYLKKPYTISIVIYFAIILTFVSFYTSKKRIVKRKIKKYSKKFVKILKIFLVMYLLIILIVDLNILSPNNIKIYFVDVGQGDCTLIVTEKNKKILVDGGGSDNKNYDIGKNITLPYLLDRRISNLDYIMISHFDSDHVQGLYAVLENIKVKNVIISKQKENSENYEKFLKIAQVRGVNIIVVKAGDRISLDRNLYIDILWPLLNEQITENPLNNNSIVAKLVYKDFSMLFTGDIEEVAEKTILKRYSSNLNVLKATVLKVAHHGSKTSSSIKFIEAVRPKFALIGVGKTNIFGHPADVTLESLKKIGAQIYRTDEDGEIVVSISRMGEIYGPIRTNDET